MAFRKSITLKSTTFEGQELSKWEHLYREAKLKQEKRDRSQDETEFERYRKQYTFQPNKDMRKVSVTNQSPAEKDQIAPYFKQATGVKRRPTLKAGLD